MKEQKPVKIPPPKELPSQEKFKRNVDFLRKNELERELRKLGL